MDLSVAVMILFAGVFSGFADAIAGGGGLIMIPALMLGGLPAHAAIGTNKLCNTAASFTSSITFARARLVDWRACVAMGLPAAFGALAGSQLISALPRAWAEPIVIVLLIAVAVFVLLKPSIGREAIVAAASPARMSVGRVAGALALGAGLGFHTGFFGPGASAFMVVAVLTFGSLNFVRGTGSAKVINLIASLTALVSFFWVGAVDLPKGVIACVGVVLGASAGASLATTKGARLMRPAFLVVTMLIVGKLLVGYLLR